MLKRIEFIYHCIFFLLLVVVFVLFFNPNQAPSQLQEHLFAAPVQVVRLMQAQKLPRFDYKIVLLQEKEKLLYCIWWRTTTANIRNEENAYMLKMN